MPVYRRWRKIIAPVASTRVLSLGLGLLVVSLAAYCCATALGAEKGNAIERIWLTCSSTRPDRITVSWETDAPADSVVEFGPTPQLGQRAARGEKTTLHHVEITPPRKAGAWHYRVRSGPRTSAVQQVRNNAGDVFRVVVVGNAGYALVPWGDVVLRERPHLLMTAGDNVPQLHTGKRVAADTTAAYSRLIDCFPDLFRTTPLLPSLGNHDKEVRPRGLGPPADAVYDIDATAFRKFFALPGDEWKWRFDMPDFGVRFVALDLNHIRDFGTTWQTCHDYRRGSEQLEWYRRIMQESDQPFLITIYNERNAIVRGLEGGEWGRLISRGSLAITGYGHFGERAEVDGFCFYNTSLPGLPVFRRDPKHRFLSSEMNLLLLTFVKGGDLTVELKSLRGKVLDRKIFPPRNM